MNFIQFITTKTFLKHLGLSVLFSFILIWIVLLSLRFYTHHNKEIITPSLINISLSQAKGLQTVKKLDLYIMDSVYDASKTPGTIITQDPAAGSKVKPGRKIYISVVSVLPEQVKMPVLVDLSIRQAKALLQTYGLVLGQVVTVPNVPNNSVIKALMNGAEIVGGTLVRKGTVIDLYVGEGLVIKQIELPFLIGKSRQEAISIINSLGLSLGGETFSPACDSITGIVFEQTPIYMYGKTVPSSTKLFLSYKSAKEFDFDSYIKNLAIDTFQKTQTAPAPVVVPNSIPVPNANPAKQPQPNTKKPAATKPKPNQNSDDRF